jgi:hypothetical protein
MGERALIAAIRARASQRSGILRLGMNRSIFVATGTLLNRLATVAWRAA